MSRDTPVRRCTVALARRIAALFPRQHREWARGMLSELEHVDGDYRALVWLLGCVTAGIKLRAIAMKLGTLKVSRFVLALEMALCFVPMTFGWLDIVFGDSGVAWLDAPIVQRYYLGTTQGVAALAKMFAGALIGVLGPLGIVVGLRYIVFGKALHRGWLSAGLVAGPIALGIVYMAANFASNTRWSIEWAGFYVLFVAVPLAGALHLLYLGYSSPDARACSRPSTA